MAARHYTPNPPPPEHIQGATSALELAIAYLRDGTLTLDTEGRFWRHYEWNGWSRRRPVEPRRAERPTKKGYLSLTFTMPRKGGTRSVLAHVLSWTYRVGPIPEGLQVNHKDLNKSNNHPDNLELLTGSENMLHAYANGRTRPWNHATEWRPGRPRLTDKQKANVVALHQIGLGSRRINKRTGISRTYIDRIIAQAKKEVSGGAD